MVAPIVIGIIAAAAAGAAYVLSERHKVGAVLKGDLGSRASYISHLDKDFESEKHHYEEALIKEEKAYKHYDVTGNEIDALLSEEESELGEEEIEEAEAVEFEKIGEEIEKSSEKLGKTISEEEKEGLFVWKTINKLDKTLISERGLDSADVKPVIEFLNELARDYRNWFLGTDIEKKYLKEMEHDFRSSTLSIKFLMEKDVKNSKAHKELKRFKKYYPRVYKEAKKIAEEREKIDEIWKNLENVEKRSTDVDWFKEREKKIKEGYKNFVKEIKAFEKKPNIEELRLLIERFIKSYFGNRIEIARRTYDFYKDFFEVIKEIDRVIVKLEEIVKQNKYYIYLVEQTEKQLERGGEALKHEELYSKFLNKEEYKIGKFFDQANNNLILVLRTIESTKERIEKEFEKEKNLEIEAYNSFESAMSRLR